MKPNWYLAKSQIKREEIGDVIVDLNLIMTMRCYTYENEFKLHLDYSPNDKIDIFFSTEEAMRAEIANIISLTGCSDQTFLAKDILPMDKSGKFKN